LDAAFFGALVLATLERHADRIRRRLQSPPRSVMAVVLRLVFDGVLELSVVDPLAEASLSTRPSIEVTHIPDAPITRCEVRKRCAGRPVRRCA
jgi:hypothetical protein